MKLPSVRKTILFLILSLVISLEFYLVYGWANTFASEQSRRFHLYFGWENEIPFYPVMIYAYVSLNALMTMTLFFLDEKDLVDYAVANIAAILIAACFFIFLPAETLWQRPASGDGLPAAYNFLVSLDRPHNLFPSLHITFSSLAVGVMIPKSTSLFKGIFALWWVLMCASVLLTHQHQVMDVFGGIFLAAFCYFAFFKKYFGTWFKKSWKRISA